MCLSCSACFLFHGTDHKYCLPAVSESAHVTFHLKVITHCVRPYRDFLTTVRLSLDSPNTVAPPMLPQQQNYMCAVGSMRHVRLLRSCGWGEVRVKVIDASP